MSFRPSDPLLFSGKVLTIVIQATMAFAAVILALVMIALAIAGTGVIESVAPSVTDAERIPVLALSAVMAVGLVIVGLGFVFFDKLRRIILTVEVGDPFEVANSARLQAMGWIALAAQLVMLPAYWLGSYLARFTDEVEGIDASSGDGIELEGLLLVVILFILARVFRAGAQMREDLEGTV